MTDTLHNACTPIRGSGTLAASPATDPKGASSGTDRVRRGGAWNTKAALCRSAQRDSKTPSTRMSLIGFRLVCAFQ